MMKSDGGDIFLSVRNLTVEYVTKQETVQAVNSVSFDLHKGKTLGLVGETGAGKTTIAGAILGVLPVPPAVTRGGEILLDGEDLMRLDEATMCKVRGKRVTVIFQDPMTALNPVMTIGRQIAEVIELHDAVSRKEARVRAERMLEMVGIPAARYDEYPNQFSGGMRQRVVIAVALACNPELLLADEPTTALDVTIQAQVLDLIRELNSAKKTSMILITHDMGVVMEMCDDVAVIYAGEIIETGTLENIFEHPAHPYTIGLFGSIPKINGDSERLSPIAGLPPNPADLPKGCKFHPRCPQAAEACKSGEIPVREISAGHFCKCRGKAGEA
ncbi:MAG: ABC transporter ATP-binding protein [Clostridiales bacterium]|jgi:peptide/nickel transport system ATP-binding protein|nr:ABC transporter ATP-binding protein [Clostridiales bacterium]